MFIFTLDILNLDLFGFKTFIGSVIYIPFHILLAGTYNKLYSIVFKTY